MRYVPIEFAKEGDYLGQPLYNEKGMILLSKGIRLTAGLIDKIRRQGYYSIYISDNVSQEEIEDIIKPEIRMKASAIVKKMISDIPVEGKVSPNKLRETEERMKELAELTKLIVDDVFGQKDLVMNLLDIKNVDTYTYAHSVNVMMHALLLGMSAQLNRNQLYDLAMGSIIHDIGKVFIPEEVLKKPGKLTSEEFDLMRQHTTKGYEFLKEYTNFSATSRIISLQHQEKVDGTGYPYQLVGNDIHIYSRITAIADVYDALTSDRYYRRALPAQEALEYIMAAGGTHFDGLLAKAFITTVNPYPVGTLVKLNNGYRGVVEKVNQETYTRPILKIYREDNREVTPWMCDLLKERTLVIENIIYQLSG